MDEVIGEPRKMQAFEVLKSTVRSYSRSFPAIFSRARGPVMLTEYGRQATDFPSDAGALNYGHANHQIEADITEYFASDAMVHGLDMATPAKLGFMETFSSLIRRERNLSYRFQFSGPAGANAMAALKLSRKVTGRQSNISFTHGYHGMSLGAVAASGNRFFRTSTSHCIRVWKQFADRGRGMAVGFDCRRTEAAATTARKAFERGLIIERCGPIDQVIEFLPALTIDHDTLNRPLKHLRKPWP